jgi:tetratricopeptide (TPR) repeat protein
VAKLSEEKELKAITKRFDEAVTAFTRKDFPAARQQFTEIIESFRDSEHYSVLEITGRSNVYLRMVDAQLTPQKIELKSAEDVLNEGVYQLNAGRIDRALELFTELSRKSEKDPYVDFLMAIAYKRNENLASAFEHLKRCIEKDEHYKVIAFNEPDFESLLEKREFIDLVS